MPPLVDVAVQQQPRPEQTHEAEKGSEPDMGRVVRVMNPIGWGMGHRHVNEAAVPASRRRIWPSLNWKGGSGEYRREPPSPMKVSPNTRAIRPSIGRQPSATVRCRPSAVSS